MIFSLHLRIRPCPCPYQKPHPMLKTAEFRSGTPIFGEGEIWPSLSDRDQNRAVDLKFSKRLLLAKSFPVPPNKFPAKSLYNREIRKETGSQRTAPTTTQSHSKRPPIGAAENLPTYQRLEAIWCIERCRRAVGCELQIRLLPVADKDRWSDLSSEKSLVERLFDIPYRIVDPAGHRRALDEDAQCCSILCTAVTLSPGHEHSSRGYGPDTLVLLFRSFFR